MPSVNEAYLNFYYEKTSVINGIYENCFTITSLIDNNRISFVRSDHSLPTYPNIQYSLDGGMSWSNLTSDIICELDAGESVMLKGTNTTLNGYSFDSLGDFNVSGNPLSMINPTTFNSITTLPVANIFKGLFSSSEVVDASKLQLPATTLTANCYDNMFSLCTSLEKAPKLPATTLANYCYSNMFNGCISLLTAPDLPATTLAQYCYNNMFNSCTSLTAAPTLPATTMAAHCYEGMFIDCDSLVAPPQLPATNLAPYCYAEMFMNCSSLDTAPALPATLLEDYCYYRMFKNCTSLIQAPLLPSLGVEAGSYREMFNGCSNLNYIKILAISRAQNALTDWVANVYPTGIFIKDPNATYPIDSVSGVPIGWTLYNTDEYIPNNYNVVLSIYPTVAGSVYGGGTYLEGTSITINAVPAAGYHFVGWYNTQNNQYTNPVSTDTTYTFTVNSNVALTAVFDGEPSCTVELSQYPYVGATLTGAGIYLNGTAVTVSTTAVEGYNFVGWKLNDNLISDSLSYTFTVTSSVSLIAVYEVIPVYTECEVSIQINNRNLGSVSYSATQPDGTVLSGSIGHDHSIINFICTNGTVLSLNATPDDNVDFVNWKKNNVNIGTSTYVQTTINNNSVILASFEVDDYEHCYLTVENIGDTLNNISILYADNGNYQCPTQSMTIQYRINNTGVWKNATVSKSITPQTIATLRINDTISFRNFSVCGYVVSIYGSTDCKVYGNIMSLLPLHYNSSSSTNDVYYGNLTNVLSSQEKFAYLFAYRYNNVPHIIDASDLLLPATTLSSECYKRMFEIVSNAQELGITSLIYPPALPATTLSERCYDGMFAYCISLTSAPVLSANVLAPYCYYNMFAGCTSLTSAPSLYATTMVRSCYEGMFQGCTSLVTAPSLPATTLAEGCYRLMFQACYGLEIPPILSATTLANNCYDSMFENCRSLTYAPSLPATTLAEYCYFAMFFGCTSLETAPTLPAETLQNSCYGSMFYGCTSLETAPTLPAETLTISCYESMFEQCYNLNSVTCLATDITASNCTMRWLADVSSTGTFTRNSYQAWGRGVSGVPENWTLQSAI